VVVEVVHFLVVVNLQDLVVLAVEVLVLKVEMERQEVLTLVEVVVALEDLLVVIIIMVEQVVQV
jgi:hypothetical protein|tara:strand:+ start:625 stop:816 length:192 start_codon:yes stop_codon:yes gene_type:complete